MSEFSGRLTEEKVSIRDLLHRARKRMQGNQVVNLSTDQDFCVNISRLLTISKEVKWFVSPRNLVGTNTILLEHTL